MRPALSLRDISFSAIVAGFVAVLVGYTSSAAIIFQAAAAAGASPIQIGGWLSMLGLGMGITSLGLSLYYRTPILTAWSTPGAALLVTSLPGTPLNEAIGVFIFASGLILLCGVTGLFARLMNHIPQAISAAMLAGILLRFGLDAFASLQINFSLSAGMCLVYLFTRRYLPRYGIVLTLLAGLIIAALQGNIHFTQQTLSFAKPEFIAPHFTLSTLLGIGIPFFVVTMASQNAPGIATLKAGGYDVPTSPLISWTALTALVLAPFGGFTVCIAAITAAICMGPDVHPDPKRRYMAAVAAGGFYLLAGVFGGTIGMLFSALPVTLIHTIAGLALLGTIAGSLQRALQDDKQRDAAVITFLITASGLTLLNVGAAFWGLIGGVLAYAIFSLPRRKMP
ncbi:benzoate/H(+) symporter BenE family transporter [Serratia fonticola]|jgi:benzoate membrane transport protein|uniref:benzoate/H(+) symporter BenE family transporter n=1 Tax=Serratia fonticola TaxID=47917 RepID=UPI0003AF28D9|nr:benzoate/H(+) symporter BenE family transporter [Serratia fonticola]ERK15748.1 Benzoate transport protein [Serratia fonticola AU-AP2C]AKG71283.1 membrane protein [Serratia fonticola]MBL5828292.1 benzoate/H(+) symporter BenE family transporter [Serratia fonticola]MBP0996074.1 benzoate/H(+) symporter BenE family transporter [Serratia fonticola]MBP1003347.1 benzoate/H(+) symporter BenE family transporter [Serratia fonticola]